MIKNTKLGIPDAMLVALIFFAGAVDSCMNESASFLMVALAMYVLLFEKGEKVKDAAKRALLLFCLFAVLQGGLHVLDYVIRILSSKELLSKFFYLLSGVRIVTYMVFGIKETLTYMSLRGTGVSVQKEEPVEPKQPEQASATQTAAPQSADQAIVCPVCGNPVDKGVHFCKKCGAKTTQ